MSTVNGVNYAKTLDPTPQTNQLDVGAWDGKVRVQFDTYEAASVADGTLIRIGKIPKGGRLLDVKVAHDDLGATAARLAVQTEGGSAEEIHADADVSSAGEFRGVKVGWLGKKMTADTVIVLEVEGAAITGTIETAVLYSLQ
jgi:hypothetical protein